MEELEYDMQISFAAASKSLEDLYAALEDLNAKVARLQEEGWILPRVDLDAQSLPDLAASRDRLLQTIEELG